MTPTMWVATTESGAWIPCPESPFEAKYRSRSVETELMNGGVYVKRTFGAHQTWEPSWVGEADELAPIRDLYNGVHGRGPFYFVDPTVTRNCFPQHWAAPRLSGLDWPSLMYGITPTYSTSPVNPGYRTPTVQATYTMASGPAPVLNHLTPRTTLAIPPTHVLNIRAWGSYTGTGVIRVTLYDRVTKAVTERNLTPSAVGDGIKIYGEHFSHCDIWLTKTDTALSSLTLAGLIASLTTTDEISTYWSTGEGNSGFQWGGELNVSTYMVKRHVAMSSTWVEVGTWLR